MFKFIKNPLLRELVDWTFYIGIALILGLLIVNFVIQRTIVSGPSMLPTLTHGDNLWVEKISPKLRSFRVGSIVTINVPEDIRNTYGREKNPIIKRIIALEGDFLEINDGKVFVNGQVQEEDYISGKITVEGVNPKFSKLTVPPGHLYVFGDNRGNSTDSRIIGPIKEEWILGRVALRLWPLDKIGIVK